MSLLNTIGWWASAIFVGGVVLLIAMGIWSVWDLRRRRVEERIVEYLSGKRDWVRGYDIHHDLGLHIAETYVMLNRLEEQGDVISQLRNAGMLGTRRYYKLVGGGRRIQAPSGDVALREVTA